MGLKDNLPQFVAQEKYTKEILEAIEPSIEDLKARLAKILLECCVTTASEEGVLRFEKDYGITFNSNLELDERKTQIINKMLADKTLTKEELSNFIKRNIGQEQYYITNMTDKYKFRVMLTNESYKEELFNALSEARPAHLIFEVKLVKYQRRCGTFQTNGIVFN